LIQRSGRVLRIWLASPAFGGVKNFMRKSEEEFFEGLSSCPWNYTTASPLTTVFTFIKYSVYLIDFGYH
jgi:hypothetical protein